MPAAAWGAVWLFAGIVLLNVGAVSYMYLKTPKPIRNFRGRSI